MEDIGLSRTIYDRSNGGFQRVGLSVEERLELLHTLRDIHVREMRECLEDAQSVLGRTAPSNLVRVACAFFERRAPATYTIYRKALGRKIHSLKNGGEGHV